MARSEKASKTSKEAPKPPQAYADTFGVYVNRAGVEVDSNGVATSFKKLRERDTTRWVESLNKATLEPADLLKAISLDPRFTINQRMAAAISAAPYFTAKKAPVSEIGEPVGEATPVSISINFKDARR